MVCGIFVKRIKTAKVRHMPLGHTARNYTKCIHKYTLRAQSVIESRVYNLVIAIKYNTSGNTMKAGETRLSPQEMQTEY